MADIQQPDIVGNYLANYYGAQDRVQKQQANQYQMQRQQVQDQQQAQQFDQTSQLNELNLHKAKVDALNNLLASVPDGNPQAFEQAKQAALANPSLGLKPEDVSNLSVADLPRLRMETGQAAQMLDLQLKKAQLVHENAATAAIRAKPTGASALAQSAGERAQLAQALGIDPRSDAGKRYILTGQMPNGLTPADRNAVQEADQKVLATKQGLGMLQQARKLSDQSNQGFGANTLAQVPALFGDKSSLNTIDFDNLLQSQVLPQLKTIFGGAPTEGERAILLELQGSSSMTRENRARILDRAIQMANERLKFYNDQAQGIRGGTYYNPGQGPLAGGQPAPAAAAPVAAPAAPKAPPPPPGFKVIQ